MGNSLHILRTLVPTWESSQRAGWLHTRANKGGLFVGFRLFRRLNIERYQSHSSVARSTMSSFHPLDRISLSGRCKHLNVWKVHDQANFSLYHYYYYYYFFQSASRSWLSLSGGLWGSLLRQSPKELPFDIITPRVLWLTVWISFTFEFEFPSLLMKLCFFYGLFFFFVRGKRSILTPISEVWASPQPSSRPEPLCCSALLRWHICFPNSQQGNSNGIPRESFNIGLK